MRNGNKSKKIKNAAVIFSLFLLIFCACEKKDIKSRLKSKDTAVVNSAVYEAACFNKSEYMAEIAALFEERNFTYNCAYAFSRFDNQATEIKLASMLETLNDKEGPALSLYLISKKHGLSARAREALEKIAGLKNGNVSALCMMALSGKDPQKAAKAAKSFFPDSLALPETVKEYALFCGINRLRDELPKLSKLESDVRYAAFAKWASRRINRVKKIAVNRQDRTIDYNPYFEKYRQNPVIPAIAGTYKSVHTANPDIVIRDGTIYFYYRGGDGRDKICLATAEKENFNGINFEDVSNNPIVKNGKSGEFDSDAALDPAVSILNKKVFLYYSGLGEGEDSIGLAVSSDMRNFKKKGAVLTGRAPETVVKNGILRMLYVLPNAKHGYSVYSASSADGFEFSRDSLYPVFDTSSDNNEWDFKSVTTPRIFEKKGTYYMIYCGDDKYMDYPPYFGIAFSYDLEHWYRGTQNPVFSRGKKGEWDDGGIWYAAVIEHKGKTYMYYEGWGGGADSHEKEYGPARSQIGMAVSEYSIEDML